ncbi:uncharacterized protein LOC123905192 [Trifolium pratense]|uniref:uncharacterized protein LOC123905192 n=1 Tax=Trifolium pratense TaxID=57577 RepID=UPI001E690600|nr:uncharacterized protein LOC123905192 [Trifolium pratense]XP_045810774.1 uncharacterized protein LOC123905192 [Trifolium pratense]
MADSTDNSAETSQRNKKSVRGPTMLKAIENVRKTGIKIPLQFDLETGECYGNNASHFKSYVALLTRERCSIAKELWKHIPEGVKNAMWTDIKAIFVIPEFDDAKRNDHFKKIWFHYAAERWKDFKSRLTRTYITDPKQDDVPPYVKYPYIKKDIWEEFVKYRQTSDFKEKSQKGRENHAKNVYPHVLSRGGYKRLEEQMINEKRLSLSKDSSGLTDDDRHPSPPERYETWTRARQKKGGEFTSEPVKKVAEKIEKIVEDSKKGDFVPTGRHDVLTEAIGTPEHGGSVRGVGKKHNITTYWGRSKVSRQSQGIDVKEQLAAFKADLEAKFEEKLAQERKMMQDSLMETLKSMGLSQTSDTNNRVMVPEAQTEQLVVTGSAKGSCSPAPVKMQNELKEVVVTESAKGSCSPAPVAEAQDNMDDVQKLLIMVLKRGEDHLDVELIHCSMCTNFLMSCKCIRELLVGSIWLDMSTLSVWCSYIHRLCIENNTTNVYGILEPTFLNIVGDAGKKSDQRISQSKCKKYIQHKLQNEKKECQLLPFNHGGHWQLIILCPKINTVVVICSLHWKLNPIMEKIVSSVFTVDQMANGNRKNNTVWLYPQARKQYNSNDCGYYVMKNMLDIVTAKITDSWMEVFNDPKELTAEEMYELRLRWSTYFLELLEG